MEIDEGNTFRKPGRQSATLITRQKSRSNRRSDSNRSANTRTTNNIAQNKNN